MTTPEITEEMIRLAAAALKKGTVDHATMGLGYWGKQAEVALRAALAGRSVVELPEPDEVKDGVPVWYVTDGEVRPTDVSGVAYVSVPHGYKQPEGAEWYGLAFVAAAREARRRASEGGDTRG